MGWWENESLLKFQSPTTMVVSGASQTGKTSMVRDLLVNRYACFERNPINVLFCYNIWQPLFDEMQKEITTINFMEGLPTEEDILKLSENKNHSICVLDDLAYQAKDSPFVQKLFCILSHHRNVTIIFIVHNIFEKGKMMRTISLNAHYIVLFRNMRDESQVRTLARQIHPENSKYLTMAYKLAVGEKRHGYLIIDLSIGANRKYHLRSGFLPGEDISVYLPLK